MGPLIGFAAFMFAAFVVLIVASWWQNYRRGNYRLSRTLIQLSVFPLTSSLMSILMILQRTG